MKDRIIAALVTGLLSGCAGVPLVADHTHPKGISYPWDAPPLERSISVRNGHTGADLTFSQLLDQLAEADVVFLGEYHTDETTHRVELAVYEGLLARRGGRVVLAMEMFERDVQGTLDDYVAGRIDEATFRENARPWRNYHTAYRPLIERARAGGLPVIASNFPKPLRRTVAMEGLAALDSLEGNDRRQVPAEIHPNTPAYWRRVDNAIRGHLDMMRRGADPDDQRLDSTQTLWDNSMGESCALALDENPGHLVLHVNGSFHSSYWDGTVRQLQLRKPDAEVLTVSMSPTSHPNSSQVGGVPSVDYKVYTESRASDLSDGKWSVSVNRDLDYLLHMPDEASEESPVPLLIWLSDGGFSAKDGMTLCKEWFGDEAALLVLQAPYRETQEDLGDGGRWFWPDTFTSDLALLHAAIEKAWAYVLRHYSVDPRRICLAGEGTGATVVSVVSLLTGRLAVQAVAFQPRGHTKIKDFPLPLPEFFGDTRRPPKSLRVHVDQDDDGWWAGELQQYRDIDFDAELVPTAHDPWQAEIETENAMRAALGLAKREPAPDAGRRHVLVEGDSPRRWHWARLRALRDAHEHGVPVAVLAEAPAEGTSEPIPLAVNPGDFTESGLPRCPGAFGGTTVLVLADDASPEDVTAWLELEANDPLNEASRFHRLRVVTAAEEGRDLSAVLEKLLSENRKNILIVPASFCADGTTMRALKKDAREFADRMTLFWMPGLGASGE